MSHKTQKRINQVPEFAFIQEVANQIGVKVWLFGGTASAFAHYVRWDLEREAGDDKYQAERFDYDFTNIYRGNQDLDIVVDGTAEQVQLLRQKLLHKFPHFVGSTEAWEIRLLRESKGDKLPLLNNFDFLNQHTDTNSTGMIALNTTSAEKVYRDLHDWENTNSRFLKDVAGGKIKFLYSNHHEETSRFKQGKNPSIFAAVRYLAKLAQYEAKEDSKDLDVIKRIIKETNWPSIQKNSYVKHKLEEFGKKVLLNAPDSEYAWNLLEETGLRKKLIEMDGNQVQVKDSLSWWMSKEPLRSKPFSTKGKTAHELFKTEAGSIIVAHETNSFQAYENITRSSKGRANVFISRKQTVGEGAVHGDGFYTKLGVKGAVGTNLTIRFKLNPKAREGEDFIHKGDYVVIKNKNALELIQENLNISALDYAKLLNSGDISDNDLGLQLKMERKLNRLPIKKTEELEIKKMVYTLVIQGFKNENEMKLPLLSFWFTLDASLKDPNLVEKLLNFNNTEIDEVILISVLGNEKWPVNDKWLNQLLDKDDVDVNEMILEHLMHHERWFHRSDIIKKFIQDKEMAISLNFFIFSLEHWIGQKDLINDYINALVSQGNNASLKNFIKSVLSEPHMINHIEIITAFIDRIQSWKLDEALIEHVLSKDYWVQTSEPIEKLIEVGSLQALINLINHVFSKKIWLQKTDLVLKLIEQGGYSNGRLWLIDNLLGWEVWAEKPEFLQEIIIVIDKHYDSEIPQALDESSFKGSHWQNHPELKTYLDGGPVSFREIYFKSKKINLSDWLKKHKSSKNLMCNGILN